MAVNCLRGTGQGRAASPTSGGAPAVGLGQGSSIVPGEHDITTLQEQVECICICPVLYKVPFQNPAPSQQYGQRAGPGVHTRGVLPWFILLSLYGQEPSAPVRAKTVCWIFLRSGMTFCNMRALCFAGLTRLSAPAERAEARAELPTAILIPMFRTYPVHVGLLSSVLSLFCCLPLGESGDVHVSICRCLCTCQSTAVRTAR